MGQRSSWLSQFCTLWQVTNIDKWYVLANNRNANPTSDISYFSSCTLKYLVLVLSSLLIRIIPEMRNNFWHFAIQKKHWILSLAHTSHSSRTYILWHICYTRVHGKLLQVHVYKVLYRKTGVFAFYGVKMCRIWSVLTWTNRQRKFVKDFW